MQKIFAAKKSIEGKEQTVKRFAKKFFGKKIYLIEGGTIFSDEEFSRRANELIEKISKKYKAKDKLPIIKGVKKDIKRMLAKIQSERKKYTMQYYAKDYGRHSNSMHFLNTIFQNYLNYFIKLNGKLEVMEKEFSSKA